MYVFKFQNEGSRATVFLSNRLPKAILGNKSPLQVLFKTQPFYLMLKSVWVLAFLVLGLLMNINFGIYQSVVLFLVIALNCKVYRCLDPNGRFIYILGCYIDEFSFSFC